MTVNRVRERIKTLNGVKEKSFTVIGNGHGILGFHVSIAGGIARSVERARLLGCNAMQIFASSPRAWTCSAPSAIDAASFREARKKAGVSSVVVHATYLINLSSPNDELFSRSVALFLKQLEISDAIGADYFVTHLGSPKPFDAAFAVGRVLEAMKTISASLKPRAAILFENTSGAGAGFGASLKDIRIIMKGADRLGLSTGLCFDTCHAFAAGYPFSDAERLIAMIDEEAGLERVKLIHLNDSKGAFQSRLDRHEHIGLGHIGAASLGAFLRLRGIRRLPIIMETPKKQTGDDEANLSVVRGLFSGVVKRIKE
ncbi:MAG: deoxyribonuclease IV [Deltaproteobacteria bacterium]|nr:deoxyribonuclease IV [Deltaproteobacteria bacterium]